MIAGILVGLQTYPPFDGSHVELDDDKASEAPVGFLVVEAIDNAILAIFGLECVVKIVAEGAKPWRFFVGGEAAWNNFDFVVVVLCLPIWGDALGGGSVKLLRLMRLARIVKLLKRVPQLYIIVKGLIGGLKSIGYIVILLFLVFYLYAICGIYLFRENDPWHFHSLPVAMLTLFRAATLEDWTDIMYVNIYGCGKFGYAGYVPPEEETPHNKPLWCRTQLSADARQTLQIISPIYWVSFVMICAIVMLSLFVGAVTMSMSESMAEMKAELEEAERKKQLLKGMEKMKELKEVAEEAEREKERESFRRQSGTLDDPDGGDGGGGGGGADARGDGDGPRPDFAHVSTMQMFKLALEGGDRRKEQRQMRELANLLHEAWEGVEMDDGDLPVVEYLPGRLGKYQRFAEGMRDFTLTPAFTNSITATILVAGVLVGLQTDQDIYPEDDDETSSSKDVIDALDFCILVIFTIEIVCKLIAEEFAWWRFFYSNWNKFDFLIVVGSICMDYGSFLPDMGSMLTMLRLLRLLRVLKLVKSFPKLAIIVNALIKGVASIGFIGLILVLVFYMFAILGMILFQDNDPWHFGTLHVTMLTLFRIATFEDWTDVMYINVLGCGGAQGNYGYDDDWLRAKCVDTNPTHFVAAAYFVLFVVIGALVLLTLFIGVVTTGMEEATEDHNAEKELEDKIEDVRERMALDEGVIDKYRRAFALIDLDSGGTIETEELRTALEAVGKEFTNDELLAMFSEVDEDGSGEIDLAEFVEFMTCIKGKNASTDETPGAAGGDGAAGAGAPAPPRDESNVAAARRWFSGGTTADTADAAADAGRKKQREVSSFRDLRDARRDSKLSDDETAAPVVSVKGAQPTQPGPADGKAANRVHPTSDLDRALEEFEVQELQDAEEDALY